MDDDDQLAREDRSLMREAIRLAARVPDRTWPNPPVGALVVRDGRIVGRGAHCGPGTPHAEVVALEQAGDLARGATLYCTLEPCNHQGRTPPCAPHVAARGLRRVVVGVRDPNPRVPGGGLDVLRGAGVDLTLGVAADEALELVWPFVVTKAFERPYVLLKTATSLDGRFAPPVEGDGPAPVYLTGVEARREVHRLRRWADLVLVGAGTMLADRPTLDARLVSAEDDCPGADPRPGYVDTDLSVESSWRGRTHLVFGGRHSAPPARAAVIEKQGGTAVLCEERHGRVCPASLLEGLIALGVYSVLLEGGPALAQSFLVAGLVDRWVSFVAPCVLGDGPTWPSPGLCDDGAGGKDCSGKNCGDRLRFSLTRQDRLGDDARLVLDSAPFHEALRRLTTLEG